MTDTMVSNLPAPMDDADRSLIERARSDPSAFADLYDRHVDAIFGYAFRRLRDRSAAEDATSIIFTKAFANLHQFSGGSFRAWLFAIARTTTIDQLRRQQFAAPLEEAWAVADPGPTPEEMSLRTEFDDEIHNLLEALSADQRQVIELRLTGLRTNEIAQILGRSRTSIDSLQYRAMTRLKELFATTPVAEGGER